MRSRLLNYLQCPSCAGALKLSAQTAVEAEQVLEGQLTCESCARSFAITRGVPRFALSEELANDKAATAENFGWQWQHFTHEEEFYADQFLDWIAPVTKDFFR